MSALHPIRLLKSYRGYRVGTVIYATPGLADHLVQTGAGVRDTQASLLESSGRPERAVAANSVEVRSTR